MPSKTLEIIMRGATADSFILLMPDGLSLTTHSGKICGELGKNGFTAERNVGTDKRHSVTVGYGNTDMKSAVRTAALVIVAKLNASGSKFTYVCVMDGSSYYGDVYWSGPVP